MREIKFRAWAKDAANRPETMWDWDTHRRTIGEWIGNQERGVTLMQYTGLLDKNGKEIYEGDILRGVGGEVAHVVYRTDVGFLGGYSFVVHGYDIPVGCFVQGDAEDTKVVCEVIGNIWEHKHLLDGSNGVS